MGGFHYAMGDACQRLGLSHECVFASDIDDSCRENYSTNFDIAPVGDITKFDESHIPEHDVLLAGFPCQARVPLASSARPVQVRGCARLGRCWSADRARRETSRRR